MGKGGLSIEAGIKPSPGVVSAVAKVLEEEAWSSFPAALWQIKMQLQRIFGFAAGAGPAAWQGK